MRIKLGKPRRLKPYKRTSGIGNRRIKPFKNCLKKGVDTMTPLVKIREDEKLNCMSNIRNRARKTMKKKGYTEQDIKRFLELAKHGE